MKLTKVLVGLLAISLCGVAAAGVKRGMSGADLRAGFLRALKANDKKTATEFINALKVRRDWDSYYKAYIREDIIGRPDESAIAVEYGLGELSRVMPAKKIEPGQELKVTGWDATWGAAPIWAGVDLSDVTKASAAVDGDGILYKAAEDFESGVHTGLKPEYKSQITDFFIKLYNAALDKYEPSADRPNKKDAFAVTVQTINAVDWK